MAGRRTNLALLVLLTGSLATGTLMFAIGSGWNRWPTVVHGAIGIAIVAVAPWKAVIARRGLRRRPESSGASLALAGLTVTALATGVAHRSGLREFGPVNAMQVHVTAAVLCIPLAAWHITRRPVRPHRADLSRRNLLRAGALAGGATVATAVLPHAGGRFTRSLERGSGHPEAMPVTQWFNDSVPDVDVDEWRLDVEGRAWTLSELDRFDDRLTATLDCTGGWYATQQWQGVFLHQLLPERKDEAASLVVRSVTGYSRRFPLVDAAQLLVATRVGGDRLSPGHGFPARLVAPGRRGFWWVKWVRSVDLSPRPWWWQSPFPLT